jgi:hypothetical protein
LRRNILHGRAPCWLAKKVQGISPLLAATLNWPYKIEGIILIDALVYGGNQDTSFDTHPCSPTIWRAGKRRDLYGSIYGFRYFCKSSLLGLQFNSYGQLSQ